MEIEQARERDEEQQKRAKVMTNGYSIFFGEWEMI
jgi:hypothetical protein